MGGCGSLGGETEEVLSVLPETRYVSVCRRNCGTSSGVLRNMTLLTRKSQCASFELPIILMQFYLLLRDTMKDESRRPLCKRSFKVAPHRHNLHT